ncbi:helix-turn-helix transcriptional regulator [Cohnella xylanilytica]|uniref:Helix-turn-helix transcriptional regulator n=1 Tax=Cohnella xylanilytica TaxID=557555 RepID=A0A841U5R9_9BACL|nr:helix-turn-helix transcriptional regulator [Cohnella xylanilytica]MBB6694418.1 helix-turn-helix transcriptional regulator [Cohnella xylanilytica]
MSVLGNRLKTEREKRGWTKKYASEKLGLKRVSTYANYEYGIRDPDTEMLAKMAELYETTTDYLLGHEEIKNTADVISNDIIELLDSNKIGKINGKIITSDDRDRAIEMLKLMFPNK